MRSSTAIDVIVAAYNSPKKPPMCFLGSPGGGKTSIVKEATRLLDVSSILKHLPTMLVEDFGIPYPDAGAPSFSYKLPDWFPSEGKPGTENGGILILDDRTQAAADLQKVLANIISERELHGVKLARNWLIVSTGNRVEDKAGANRILSHLADRETIYNYEVNLDDWTKWAINKKLNQSVISFIRFKNDALHDFDPQRTKNATPRGWERVSDLIGVVPPEAEYETFCGTVGDGRAAEFSGFLRIWRDLPDPLHILMNPDTAKLPTDIQTLYALAGSLSSRVTDANFGNMIKYFDRLPDERSDISVLAVSYAVRTAPNLAHTAAFTAWAVKHQNVLF